jgi:hypothetical protein
MDAKPAEVQKPQILSQIRFHELQTATVNTTHSDMQSSKDFHHLNQNYKMFEFPTFWNKNH